MQECRKQECRKQECIAQLYFESLIFAFVHFCIRAFVRGALAPPIELVQLLLERFELLPGFAELAFGRQPLIVSEVARGLGYERVDVDDWRARRPRPPAPELPVTPQGPLSLALPPTTSVDAPVPRSAASAASKVGRVRQPILQREHDEPELGHRAALGLQVDRFGVQQRAADRNDDQRAAPYVRSLLVPQRQLS